MSDYVLDMETPIGLFEMGKFLHAKGEFEESVPFFQHALERAESERNIDLTQDILSSLGIVSVDIGEEEEALYYFKEAIIIDEEKGDNLAKFCHLVNIAHVYIQLHDARNGFDYSFKALSVLEEVGMGNSPEANAIRDMHQKLHMILYPDQ